jgi:hypothetical protein
MGAGPRHNGRDDLGTRGPRRSGPNIDVMYALRLVGGEDLNGRTPLPTRYGLERPPGLGPGEASYLCTDFGATLARHVRLFQRADTLLRCWRCFAVNEVPCVKETRM